MMRVFGSAAPELTAPLPSPPPACGERGFVMFMSAESVPSPFRAEIAKRVKVREGVRLLSGGVSHA